MPDFDSGYLATGELIGGKGLCRCPVSLEAVNGCFCRALPCRGLRLGAQGSGV